MFRRIASVVGAVSVATGMAACGSSSASPASSSAAAVPPAVTILNFSFGPTPLKVTAGTQVTWTNQDSAAHTATSDDGKFDSKTLDQNKTFMFTFSAAGTYKYHCAIHSSMTGEVDVT